MDHSVRVGAQELLTLVLEHIKKEMLRAHTPSVVVGALLNRSTFVVIQTVVIVINKVTSKTRPVSEEDVTRLPSLTRVVSRDVRVKGDRAEGDGGGDGGGVLVAAMNGK